MEYPYFGYKYPASSSSSSSKIKSKHVVIAAFVVVTVFAITGFAMYGRGLGDPNCDCTKPIQAGWNMGSTVLVLIVMMATLVLIWRPEMLVSV